MGLRSEREERPRGLKPPHPRFLRGPEGPLFHGTAGGEIQALERESTVSSGARLGADCSEFGKREFRNGNRRFLQGQEEVGRPFALTPLLSLRAVSRGKVHE